jgi:hypothetical protein
MLLNTAQIFILQITAVLIYLLATGRPPSGYLLKIINQVVLGLLIRIVAMVSALCYWKIIQIVVLTACLFVGMVFV